MALIKPPVLDSYDGRLHACICSTARVRASPYAHAKVVKIDTSAAEALPGVVTVCTFENTTNKPFNTSATMVTTPRPAEPVRDQTIFTDEPKYIGDEVAAVAAETEAIAAEPSSD